MSPRAEAGGWPLSMWTCLYWELSPEDALRHLADQGWRYLDLAAEHFGELWRAQDSRRVDAWRALAERLGMTAWQCHLFMDLNLTAADAAERAETEALLDDHLGLARRLGVGTVVLHPGWLRKGEAGPPDVIRRGMEESLKRAASRAAEAGVRIAVENTCGPVFGADPADLARLAEAVDPAHLGLCLDSSHANVDRRPAGEAVRACGRSLFCLHLSDNDGSGDQHRLPYDGTVDWPGLLQALREIGYSGPLNFEVPGLCHRPLPVRDAALPYLQSVMSYAASGKEPPWPRRTEAIVDYCRQGWFDPKFGYP